MATYSIADDLNIDKLLTDIKVKSDLSSKTKLENGGISIVYTRDDLDRMQARTLKDILKSTFPYHYSENRLNIPDPFTKATFLPYNSSLFRLFIDNQEITTSLYGSGLFTMGDVDIDFVDHIEIYSKNPSYEFTSEAAFVMIKLYSKNASKDNGSSVKLEASSYGASKIIVHNSAKLDKFSYFAYASGNIDKRQTHKSYDTDLSRDKNVMHLFASIYNKKDKILIDVLKQSKDAFMNYSIDATPVVSTIDLNSLHIGYNTKVGNFSMGVDYDYLETKLQFLDDLNASVVNTYALVNSIDVSTKSDVITAKIKYNYITEKNNLIVGSKYRFKKYSYGTLKVNDVERPRTGNTNQRVANIFVENQYSIKENAIITLGIQASSVRNNNSIQQDNLIQYRTGYTYTTKNIVIKTVFAHLESTLDPFLVNSYGSYITDGKKDIVKANTISNNFIYETKLNKYEFAFGMIKKYNELVPTANRWLLDNQDKTITMYGTNFKWTHNYNEYNKLFVDLGYSLTKDYLNLDDIKQYSGVIRNINTYKKFDIFNEIVYYRDNQKSNNNNFDYSAGIKYHHSDSLTFFIKGENILNKAKKTTFIRRDSEDPINPDKFMPLAISPIDQTVYVGMEYIF